MITGIVVALPEEISTLTSKKIDKGCYAFVSNAIVVSYSGAGASNAQAAARLLVEQGATRLISWGCAAALSDTLQSGDLVLADSLIDATGYVDANFGVSPEWHSFSKARLSTHLKVHTGSLIESHGIVEAISKKKRIHQQTGAVALDMESVAIAKVAGQNGLPFLAIRAIADPVNMNLPKAISYSLNKDGDIALTRLLLFVALHPNELAGLIKLGLHFNAAKKTLRLVSRQLDTLSTPNEMTLFT